MQQFSNFQAQICFFPLHPVSQCTLKIMVMELLYLSGRPTNSVSSLESEDRVICRRAVLASSQQDCVVDLRHVPNLSGLGCEALQLTMIRHNEKGGKSKRMRGFGRMETSVFPADLSSREESELLLIYCSPVESLAE